MDTENDICAYRWVCHQQEVSKYLFTNLYTNLFTNLFINLFTNLFTNLYTNLFTNLFATNLFANLFTNLFTNLFSNLFANRWLKFVFINFFQETLVAMVIIVKLLITAKNPDDLTLLLRSLNAMLQTPEVIKYQSL